MIHNYHDWPKIHHQLLIAAIITAVAAMLVYIVLIRPEYAELEEARESLRRTERKLKETTWPRDEERLKMFLKQYEKALGTEKNPGLAQMTRETLSRCTSLFSTRIASDYESDQNFITKASQIEYKDQYDRLTSALSESKVNLTSKIYGMDETTVEPLKYQMLLKLWATELAVNKALASKLSIATVPSKNANDQPARVTALPIKNYSLDVKDTVPYLIEIPIQMTVTGNMEDFIAFCNSLQTEDTFMPVTQIEIVSLPPGKNDYGNKDGMISVERIRATIICSAFYQPPEAKTTKPGGSSGKSNKPTLPAGA